MEVYRKKINLSNIKVALETQLETIIVISELNESRSETLLISVLKDSTRNEELRAGAAWALGQFQTFKSAQALVDTFNARPEEIRHEAARALIRVAEPQVSSLVELLQNSDPSKRDGISWVLARIGKFSPNLINTENDENLKKWLSYIVGYGKNYFSESDIERLCNTDPEVYFAASVLWQLFSSWIYSIEEY